ncbi:uncharacterized protein LOC118410560 [Branchiostoma floridae]|uniref:Uncharacterized protein LOC118410560 n=1 Tax=Branchiostoma floridae TaxID=7739 RepID=A0A9J7MIN4_BRAFL|nr:uncharacterized protein LOC118410560 [Branchiostoma floridae]
MSWDDEEIGEYQGSNSTIAVRYSAFDRESQVAEYFWAIGTAPWATDVQPFKSNGLQEMAVNSDLEGILHHGSTYYVTLKAVNGAGLETTVTSSGVKVLQGYPNVTKTNTTALFGANLPHDVYPDDVMEVTDLTHVGISWERPQEDQSITSIFFSVSSSEDGTGDIFPKTRVGLNDSGSVVIADGKVETYGRVVNITDIRQHSGEVKDVVESSKFVMEPGRTLYPKLLLCNGAHQCTDVNVKKSIYIRPGDITAVSHNGEGVEVVLNQTKFTSISIRTPGGLRKGTAIVSGLLEDKDITTEYTSDASADFKPFVTDPSFTKDIADRWLKNRIQYWLDVNFFVTTLGNVELPGPINITVPINTTQIEPGLEPRLLYWNLEQGEWQDAQRTCSRGGEAQTPLDWTDNYAHFQVCKTNVYNRKRNARRMPKSIHEARGYFQGSTHLTLAAVDKTFLNSPPVLTSDTYINVREDEERAIMIEYYDNEDDRLAFFITGPPHLGQAQLRNEEDFLIVLYDPRLDCYGTDTINILAVEMLPNNMNPHHVNVELVVEVQPSNDDPVLFVLVENNPAVIVPTKRLDLTVEVNRVSNVKYIDLQVVIGAYDVEPEDTVTLYFSAGGNGTISTSQQERRVDFSYDGCSTNNTWFSVVREHDKSNSTRALHLGPCDIQAPHPLQDMAWVFTTLTYRPHTNFTGRDVIKINARDQHGGISRVVTLDLYVLENLCEHGGECVGDVTDTGCTSKDRAKGFDGYWCNCTSAPGWTGRLCQTDYDECLSTPCPGNYTCIDQVNGYVCECGNPSWPCAGKLTAWQICLIVLAAVFLLLLAIFLWRKWKRSSDSVKRTESMFFRGSRVSPGNTLINVKPVHGETGRDGDAKGPEPCEPRCDTGLDRDGPASCQKRRAWEGDNTSDRQAAALLNWQWKPTHSTEICDRPIGLLPGAVTELKPLRGTPMKKADL